MKEKAFNFNWRFFVLAVFFAALGACPGKQQAAVTTRSNSPFFHDATPAQGPWKVDRERGEGYYAKVYAHRKSPVLIVTSFIEIRDVPPADLTDRRNQQILAEQTLLFLCEGVQFECLVQSSDVAWIVGSPLKYIYVRFKAQKTDMPVMSGLLYYRIDPPVQTMYMLIASEEVFYTYENVFLDYVGEVKFDPGSF